MTFSVWDILLSFSDEVSDKSGERRECDDKLFSAVDPVDMAVRASTVTGTGDTDETLRPTNGWLRWLYAFIRYFPLIGEA